ncbi:hypothetical protein EJ06DRAFT_512161 [Trichodelitschia bisporula]|uniref:SWR1-complex protein 4 n=1 Tax=Trichodelitschia bisporula TaxID=703511 RepID=A0A6G1HT73_9PEZI|nr:hypothetical protein EJ06DRAFT_512161 [Trichodelitschia bisporula]
MASRKDVQDIMGLPAGDNAVKSAALRRPKALPAQKRVTGINREILALHGDRAPPISIVDSKKTYRGKLHRDYRPSKWERRAFINPARTDGLVLRHWQQRKAPKPTNDAMDVDGQTVEGQDPDQPEESKFAKYNVEVTVPTYDDATYDQYLQSEDWSKEETDYMLNLVQEYNQRWPVIIDRYDFPKSNSSPKRSRNSDALARPQDRDMDDAEESGGRTLEDIKARYYDIYAKTMSISTGGPFNMNEAEFQLHEMLMKYDPETERTRKNLAWMLCKRPAEEVREEEYLLSELQRIMMTAQRFEAERAEVRQRLEPVNALGSAAGTTAAATASSYTALNQLYTQLATQDRNRKARHRLSLASTDLANSPAMPSAGLATPTTATGHRDSIGGSGTKKGAAPPPQPVRQLSPRDEARFGVTTHERLQSGVSFRTDKVVKLRQAKSQIQTQKIGAALTELGVPELISLPTARVVEAFEGLVQRVIKLIESRKVVEKEENEVRVQAALHKELVPGDKEGTEAPEGEATGEKEKEKENGNKTEAEGGMEAPPAVGGGEEIRPPSSKGNAHKRSASVLSAASAASSKRSRKR